jgi:hypothetical protein
MPHSSLDKEEFEDEQVGNSMRLDLLRLQLKILRLFGVLAPKSVLRSSWKYKLFISVSTMYFLVYIPQVCSMLVAIYKYWGNIDMITKIIFQITFAADAVILTSYFILRGRKLALLFDMLETNFVLYIENVVTPENKLQILKEASRNSVVIICVLVCIFSSVILGWTCSPLILKYIDTSTQKDIESTSEEILKYYCYILWIPEELSGPYTYKVMYLYQALTIFISVGHYTSCNVILLFLMFHISTHFKLLESSFENMGKVALEERDETGEQIHGPRRLRLFMNSTINNDLIHDSCMAVCKSSKPTAPNEEEKPCFLNRSQYPESIQTLTTDDRCGSQTSAHENMDNLRGAAFDEEQMNEYFINCIKYHQAILE